MSDTPTVQQRLRQVMIEGYYPALANLHQDAAERIDTLERVLAAQRKSPDPLSEALNSGDGSYRP